MNEKDIFQYSYSAKEQEEIRKIREKYMPKEENRLEQLRRLDQSVAKSGAVAAITLGIISTLVLGVGMCCVMVWALFVQGIVIGVAGLTGIILAYPIYNRITKKRRKELTPEIIRLTDELSNKK